MSNLLTTSLGSALGTSLSSTLGTTTSISLYQLLISTGASLILGLITAYIYMYKNKFSKSFVITLALLPAMVQIVIMIVNGNIGTGIAVMGAFSLVRFRSIPGSAREIGSIFFAMALGLATGTGFIVHAFLFLVIVGSMSLWLTGSRFGNSKAPEKILKISIPENLNYDSLFDDLFALYVNHYSLQQVRTTNMGSLFELTYHIEFKNDHTSSHGQTNLADKAFIDAIRCRNGNLNVSISRTQDPREAL